MQVFILEDYNTATGRGDDRNDRINRRKEICCRMEGQEKRKEVAYFTHMTAASQPANNSCHSAILLSP